MSDIGMIDPAFTSEPIADDDELGDDIEEHPQFKFILPED